MLQARRTSFLGLICMTCLLTGCGSSSSTSSPPTTSSGAASSTGSPPAPAGKPAHECVGGGQYGGIGASVAGFKNQNPSSANPPPSQYQPGIAFYEIKGTAQGCVTDYKITEATTPTQSSRELLSLVAGISLPNDAQQLINQNTCEVWKSAGLQKATGKAHAVGFVVVAPQGEATGIVEMTASATSKC